MSGAPFRLLPRLCLELNELPACTTLHWWSLALWVLPQNVALTRQCVSVWWGHHWSSNFKGRWHSHPTLAGSGVECVMYTSVNRDEAIAQSTSARRHHTPGMCGACELYDWCAQPMKDVVTKYHRLSLAGRKSRISLDLNDLKGSYNPNNSTTDVLKCPGVVP